MNNYYKKINFTKEFETFVVATLKKITEFVLKKDPKCELYDYWGICENPDAELVTKKTTAGDENRKLNTSLTEVVDHLPELKQIFDILNLHAFVGKNLTANFPVHRHVFNPESRWALCLLLGDNNDGIVNFYKLDKNSKKPHKECDYNYMYDQLSDDDSKLLEFSINVKSNEVYCFNVWEWHNYVVTNENKVSVYLLYFKNVITINDLEEQIKKIKDASNQKLFS